MWVVKFKEKWLSLSLDSSDCSSWSAQCLTKWQQSTATFVLRICQKINKNKKVYYWWAVVMAAHLSTLCCMSYLIRFRHLEGNCPSPSSNNIYIYLCMYTHTHTRIYANWCLWRKTVCVKSGFQDWRHCWVFQASDPIPNWVLDDTERTEWLENARAEFKRDAWYHLPTRKWLVEIWKAIFTLRQGSESVAAGCACWRRELWTIPLLSETSAIKLSSAVLVLTHSGRVAKGQSHSVETSWNKLHLETQDWVLAQYRTSQRHEVSKSFCPWLYFILFCPILRGFYFHLTLLKAWIPKEARSQSPSAVKGITRRNHYEDSFKGVA